MNELNNIEIKNNRFYFRNTIYETYDEFIDDINEHAKKDVTDEDILLFFEHLAKNVLLNMHAYDVKIKNHELDICFDEIFDNSLKTICKDIFKKGWTVKGGTIIQN